MNTHQDQLCACGAHAERPGLRPAVEADDEYLRAVAANDPTTRCRTCGKQCARAYYMSYCEAHPEGRK